MRKGQSLQINNFGKTGYSNAKKKNEIGSLYLRPLTKETLKWIKDLDLGVRPKTVILLERNIGENLLDLGLGNDFLDVTPKVQVI